MKKVLVKKDSYYDSVFLMLLSRELKDLPDIHDATVAMGTPLNLQLLSDSGYLLGASAGVGPGDLVIAVDCPSAASLDAAMKAAEVFLSRTGRGGAANPRDLEGALARLKGANLAVISLPGAYAVREARKALEKGLHVMLFSDQISLEDEVALKTFARGKGLLVMGPDCGTAIIDGVPLCFANTVRRGKVGLVAASGTGLQEVTCLLDRLGAGVSQAIGTGGRDLKNEKVGGLMMLTGIEALAADSGTEVIAVLSKPPARSVAGKVLSALDAAGKPAVVCFLGVPGQEALAEKRGILRARNLEETARMAAALAKGEAFEAVDFDLGKEAIRDMVDRETSRMTKSQKFVRGYFTGGTLADEAWILLHGLLGAVYSNNQTDPAFLLPDPRKSIGHTIVDLGDDAFTLGRPHPMIDPGARTERVDAEREDGEIAVMLFDLVLGYGSHPDPAGALVPSIAAAKEAAARRGGYRSAVASITGTRGDFQGFEREKAILESAGVVVLPSNHQASLLASRIMEKAAAR